MSKVPIPSAVNCTGASSAGGFELIRIESNGLDIAVSKTEMIKKKAVMLPCGKSSVYIYDYFPVRSIPSQNFAAGFFPVGIKLNIYRIHSLW